MSISRTAYVVPPSTAREERTANCVYDIHSPPPRAEYIYPCPLDERLLEFVGLTSEQFTAAVKTNPTDEGMTAWFAREARPHSPAELEEWNRTLLTRRPSSPESAARFKQYLKKIDPSRTDITAWSDLQDLEKGRVVPRREPAPQHQ